MHRSTNVTLRNVRGKSSQNTEAPNDHERRGVDIPKATAVKMEIDNNPSRSSSSSEGSPTDMQESIAKDNQVKHEEYRLNDKNNIPPRSVVAAVNTPEKIVLCVDLSEGPDATPFKLCDGTVYTPFSMIKRTVEIFVFSKSNINKRHAFALVALRGDETIWMTDFTHDPRVIIKHLNKCSPLVESDTFNLSGLFDVLRENVALPSQSSAEIPDFVPRVIVVYSRSNCIPRFHHGRAAFNILVACPFMTLDLLYVHEDVSKDNKCDEIFNQLMELDHQGYSYVFHCARSPKTLHDNMAKLLAHPLQRPSQKNATYKLKEQVSMCKLKDG